MKFNLPTKITTVAIDPEATKPVVPEKKLSLLERAKQRQKANSKQAKKEEAVGKALDGTSPRGLLYGTGITKSLLNKVGKKLEKELRTPAMVISDAEKQIKVDNLKQVPTQPKVLKSLNFELKNLDDKGLEYDADQLAAIEGGIKNRYCCIVGQAGTGKTTVSKAVIAAIQQYAPVIDYNQFDSKALEGDAPKHNLAMCIVGFTGRSVQQIKSVLPDEYKMLCSTIHTLLGYRPVEEDVYDDNGIWVKQRKIFRPHYTATNKLPHKICVVDETGMVPIALWNELIAALPDDCRVILLGDINQLPPVTGRSVLGFAMTKWPTYTLTKLHRNAGSIAKNAHRILEGKLPLPSDTFAIQWTDEGAKGTLQTAKSLIKVLHKGGAFNPRTDIIITPQNCGMLGQEQINQDLVYYFNPIDKDAPAEKKRVLVKAGKDTHALAPGDKVMVTKNNREQGLTNGMTGRITAIYENTRYSTVHVTAGEKNVSQLDIKRLEAFAKTYSHDDTQKEEEAAQRQASHIVHVEFDGAEGTHSFSTAAQMADLKVAYAVTCHKSQGGEYPTVFIIVHSVNGKRLNREWLYTAVTRAKCRVVILANREGLQGTVRKQAIKGKTIEEKIASFMLWQDNKDITQPNLPEPVEA